MLRTIDGQVAPAGVISASIAFGAAAKLKKIDPADTTPPRSFGKTELKLPKARDVTVMTESARVIAGCREGNAECFSELVDVYATRCYGYFYRLTGDSNLSEELLSELFLRLVVKISSYKNGLFDSWLFKIASNIFHDYLRNKKRSKQLLDVHRRELESKAIRAKMSDEENIDKLQIQLGKLDQDTRELIMLRFYSGLSLREIADLRSKPIGTISCKLHRGLQRLRQLMAQPCYCVYVACCSSDLGRKR